MQDRHNTVTCPRGGGTDAQTASERSEALPGGSPYGKTG